MIIRDFAVANHHMMRQHTADRFVEAAADGFLRDGEFRPSLSSSRVQFRERLFDEV